MRVSEETLNRGWVGMGWWVRALLLGAYNNTTHQQHFLLSHTCQRKNQQHSLLGHARHRKNLVLR